MSDSFDILAFSPHPDDAALGCGGTLALAVHSGLRVAVADLSEGEMSSRGTPAQRQQEKETAQNILGVQARFSLGLPDSKIKSDSAAQEKVIALIRKTRPQVILAPYGECIHPDHSAAAKLVRDAAFFAGVRKIGEGESCRPERLFHYMIHQPFNPSLVVDISEVWTQKMAAVKAYKSQFEVDDKQPATNISRPNFMKVIEARSIWFGAMIGAAHGEAFWLSGPVSSHDIQRLIGGGAKIPQESHYRSGF